MVVGNHAASLHRLPNASYNLASGHHKISREDPLIKLASSTASFGALCSLSFLEYARSHPVESRAEGSLHRAQFRRVVVVGLKPAVIAVVGVVPILVAQHLSDARATILKTMS